MIFDKYWKEAKKEADKKRLEDKRKQAFLDQKIDYAYMEELVQKINENPQLRIQIVLSDGTRMTLDTTPKRKQLETNFIEEDLMLVK